MSTSPLPQDPYEALGVSKECDLDEIKKAHRKLVLKHHPDRIKDPALVEQGKIEFHKVQQAYELLIDPVRRDRYNDQCRLAQLRKERMMNQTREMPRDSPARDSYSRGSYPTPPSTQSYNTPPPRREPMPQQSRPTVTTPLYEERVPNDYFDIPKYSDPPISKGHTRKADSYDRRASASRASEKPSPKPKATHFERPSSAKVASSTIFGMKKAGESAKKKVAQETHARTAKMRDVEQQRDRDMKHEQTYPRYNNGYNARVSDDHASDSSESSSGEDEPRMKGRNFGRGSSPAARDMRRERSRDRNVRQQSPVPVRKSTRDRSPVSRSNGRGTSPSAAPRPSVRDGPISRSQSHLTPDYAPKRTTSPRPARQTYFEQGHESPDEQHDVWQEKHKTADDYINASRKSVPGRPPTSRQNSDIHVDQYWTASTMRSEHKRSGSDSDRQRERPPIPKSSSHRRSTPQEYEPVRRSMPQEYDSQRPALSTQHSAPAATRAMAAEAMPTRLRQNSFDPRDLKGHRSDLRESHPRLNRSPSAPIPPSDSKRDTTAPIKSSGLKQSEINHDSGYGSGSSPQTPETGGESPPNEREREREREPQRPTTKRQESKTTYKIHKDSNKVAPSPQIVEEPFPPMSKHLSPEDYRSVEDRHGRRSSRTREEDRPRAGRERRPSVSRNDSVVYEERSSRSKHYRSPERTSSSRNINVDPNDIKYSSRGQPKYADYTAPQPSRHHSHHGHRDSKPRMTNLFGAIVG